MSCAQAGDSVPAALAARMDELLRARSHSPEHLLDAAIAGLEDLLKRDPAEHTALDLLAIDGLATAAFASVLDATELEALADRASKELMALGDRGA